MKTLTLTVSLFAVALGFFWGANPTLAATFEVREHYTLPGSERVPGNLYVGGADVQVLGAVSGDVTTAGSKVLVTGAVQGDITAAGGTVDILSPVSGDVRVTGGTVTVGNVVNGDLVVLGGMVHVLAGSVIRGDVLLVGGELALNGAVMGNVRARGGKIALEAPINGSADVHAGEMLTFATTATIGGNFNYTAPTSLTIRDGAVRGEIKYTAPTTGTEKGMLAVIGVMLGIFFLMKVGGLLAGALIASIALPRYTQTIMERAVVQFGTSLLLGFAVLIVTPVLAVLIAVTIVGILPAIFIFIAYILLLIVAKIYAGILVGAFLSSWWKKDIRTNWKWAVLGTLVLVLIGFLPLFGGLASFLFFTASLGAIVSRGHRAWKGRNDLSVAGEVL